MTGGALISFAYEDWARENVVRAFITAWAGIVLVWLILDWLGNPNRGRFRPQGPRRGRGIRGRISAWREQRDKRDAEIRETLRVTYGKSSLRLRWSNIDETSATAHDEARLRPVPQLMEIGDAPSMKPPTLETERLELAWALNNHEVIDLTDKRASVSEDAPERAIFGARTDEIDLTDANEDALDNDEVIDLTDRPEDALDNDEVIDLTDRPEAETAEVGSNGNGREPANQATATVVRIGWQTGDDPRAPTLAGFAPTRTTMRSRAWKNQSLCSPGLGDRNQQRMSKGRPPRRWNPITGRPELARIDVDDESLAVDWTTRGVDPFAVGVLVGDDQPS